MRRFITTLALLCVIGCTSVEKNGYIAIGSTTTAVELARQTYIAYANSCHCVQQADFERLQGYYVKYQQAAKLAQDGITNYLNAGGGGNKASLDAVLLAASQSAADIVAMICANLPAYETEKLKTKMPKVRGVTTP